MRLLQFCKATSFLLSSFRVMSLKSRNELVLDSFGKRQFNNPSYVGTQICFNEEEFERKVNEFYNENGVLVDGYAPFCKHIFIPNFASVRSGYIEINDETRPFIESCYDARTERELPVLIQFIDRLKVEPPEAKWLDVILYSRDQITRENLAMGLEPPQTDSPWGIISVKGQDCNYELPMQPITMMRNALGKEHGGSGVPIDRTKYLESVEFWQKHVSFK